MVPDRTAVPVASAVASAVISNPQTKLVTLAVAPSEAAVAAVVPVAEAVTAVGVVVVAFVGYCDENVNGTEFATVAGPRVISPGLSVASVVRKAVA